MRIREISTRILDALVSDPKRALSESDISKALALRGNDKKKLSKTLDRMQTRGEIKLVGKQRYALAEPQNIVTGTIQMSRHGTGFVRPEDGGSDIMIPARMLASAMPGDKVMAQLDARAKHRDDDRRSGKIIGVVERADVDVVGTLRTDGRSRYVVPLDTRYAKNFIVQDIGDAHPGDRVVARLTSWAEGAAAPQAAIIDVIGPADVPSLDTMAIIRHFGLAEAFSPDVMREAEGSSRLMDEPGQRRDLRNELILTIDPETARDFDDALSLTHDKNGRRVLGVHIADVSHFVPMGGALDEEAKNRGNSVYLPDKVIPMLPEQLSNGICSLKPHVDRLAFSVFITLDANGTPVASEFAKSIIRSKARLTYEEVMWVLDPSAKMAKPREKLGSNIRSLLNDLGGVAQEMRFKRFHKFALNISTSECKIVLDSSGRISDLLILEDDPSHQLVEECMIAANEAVDRALSDQGEVLIHRVHQAPAPQRLDDLASDLRGLGFKPGNLKERRHLARFLEDIEGDPMAPHVRTMVLRSMKRAEYSAEAGGHYGLSKTFYAHFTSPIRRYADLVVHRILMARLEKHRRPYQVLQLAALSAGCTASEQAADSAERQLTEIKKYRFLEQQIQDGSPLVYEGVVVGAMRFGVFVELIDLQIEGLLEMRSRSQASVHHDRTKQSLRVGNRTYQVGQTVRVYATSVDLDSRKINFAEAPDDPSKLQTGKGRVARATDAPKGAEKKPRGRRSRGRGRSSRRNSPKT
ncbi:MAG: ribonuclease R [Verrucomicrobia bacterium]|nr:ribonuclease R [Verrucomicrobiota bacterium]